MKKAISYIFLTLYIISTWNVFIVDAAIGDIGHWRDSIGGQIPGTTFGGFDFNQQVRNDGIYTKPNNNTIQFSEAGDYLVIATIRGVDNSNGRYNAQARVALTAGTGNVFSSYYTGYSRDNSENTAWFRAVGVVIGASANSQVQVQRRRDTDVPTSGSIPNQSDVQVIRLSQSNYGLYNIGGTGNAYGGTTPNTVDITSIVSQSNIAAIEGNITTDTVTLRGDNKKYLVAWSVSFDTGGARTQRIGHLEYDNVDKLSTRSYCYQRNTANEYCGIGSMDVIQTSTADIAVQSEVFRGPGVAADQGGADDDGNAVTDGNGQMIVLEMPDYLEVFRSEDSVGLQDITTAQTLNIARDVNFNNPLSFTKNSNSLVNVVNPADIFSWANIWTARNNIAAGQRQTSYGSITIDGVKQSVGEHGNYSRGNQASTDTFAMSFHPAGIFTTTGAGTTLGVSTDPLVGGESGGNDRTQAGTVGFFALNLDTLVAPSLNQSSYRLFTNTNSTDVGGALAAQNTSATLSTDGQAFRLRSLMSVTQNKLRQNEKTFKLQFAQKVGTCDTSFTGEVYTDVTPTSAIAFNNNATPTDETPLAANANDPVNGATPVINQSYQELNNFTTSVAAIPEDQDGKWDFSLIDNTAPDSTSYCFRMVESNGTLLNTYSTIPEITTAPPAVAPILSVTNTDNDTDNTVSTSQIVRYTTSITNSGTSASGISSISTISSNMGIPYNFIYSNCGSPSSSFSAPSLTFSNISIASTSTCTLSYDVQVNPGAPNGASITNSADVSAAVEGGNDPATVNTDTLSVLACGVNDVSLVFETDNYGEDIFWSLTPSGNSCGVGQVASGGNPNLTCSDGGTPATATASDPYADNTTITEGAYSLTVGNTYDLHYIDDYGDGNTGADPDVAIQQNGGNSDTFSVTGNGGVFSFVVQEPLGCADTIKPSVTINQSSSQVDPTTINSVTFKVVFNEVINTGTFTAGDITLSGTTGTVTSGPTEVSPNNGTSFEFTVTGMTTGNTVVATIGDGVVSDLSGNTNNASSSTDNSVSYIAGDTTPPTITSQNFASGSLLPGGNHDMVINYSDVGSGINPASATIELYKWNGTSWGTNIAGGGFSASTITTSSATYPTNNLDFGKYLYAFQISDNSGNTSSVAGLTFYIDKPEIIIGNESIDIGNLSHLSPTFSDTVTITVKTLGAGFNVTMNRTSPLTQGGESIQSWDGTRGYGYQKTPYSGSITAIGTNEIIATQVQNINTNGLLYTYTYNIQIGALIEQYKEAGDYEGSLDFGVVLNY